MTNDANKPEADDPFAALGEFKPRAPRPALPQEVIDQVADAAGFPSRQAPKVAQTPTPEPSAPAGRRRERRVRKTGRSEQFNIKAKPETIDEFYELADAVGVDALGELLEMMIATFKKDRHL